MKYDVAIIGAGPGGGMAAYRLAETGVKTIILEKRRLPRTKACGGAMPSRVRAYFEWDMGPIIEAQVSKIKYVHNHRMPKFYETSEPYLIMVRRSAFDLALIEHSLSLSRGNVELREGLDAVQVEESAGEVTVLCSNGDIVRTDLLIAADGALSKTARCLGLNKGAPYGLAMSAEVEVLPEIFEAHKQHVTFNLFCLPRGYGWIFPKNGFLSCGVGSWPLGPGLPGAMGDFIERSFPAGTVQSVKRLSHPIPIYGGERKISTNRVFLVGDAANLVEPVMGEGIRFALQSGAIAADVVKGVLGIAPVSETALSEACKERGAGKVYQEIIYETFGKWMEELYRFALPVFLEAPDFFYRKFILEGVNYAGLCRGLAEKINAAKSQPAGSPQ